MTSIYCNVCLAFSNSDSLFTTGLVKFSHVYQRIFEHEESKSHNLAVNALFNAEAGKDIESAINTNLYGLRQRDVAQNVAILERLLCIVKFLGKQSLPYRGHRGEAVCDLHDTNVNHGNFLELVLLLAQFDTPLNAHVHKALEASKKRQQRLRTNGKKRVGVDLSQQCFQKQQLTKLLTLYAQS